MPAYCSNCGASLSEGSSYCSECGSAVQKGNQSYSYSYGVDPSWPSKNKIAARILAILLGGIGVHKFYLGKVGMGI